MLPAFLLLGGCDMGETAEIDDDLQDIIDNVTDDPNYYDKFTYTYYTSAGKKLQTSAFSEVYVFVDPGKDGSFYDKKTGHNVGFAELADRELKTLSKDIAYKLFSVYGESDVLNETMYIEQSIKDLTTSDTYNSDYKVKITNQTSLGDFIEADKTVYLKAYPLNKYSFDDIFTLSLLNVNCSDGATTGDENLSVVKSMFQFNNAMSGYGFNVNFSDSDYFSIASTSNADRSWNSVNLGKANLSDLAMFIYEKILEIKSGGNNIYNIDRLGFTTAEIASIKSVILNEVIGASNVNADNAALQNIIKNSNDVVQDQGEYITLNPDLVSGKTIVNGNNEFNTAFENYLNGNLTIDAFKATDAFGEYASMFEYKAYETIVDAIVDEALNSPEYNGSDLVDANESPLYFMYPRIAVMIVPGIYLGGDSDDYNEDVEEDEDYDFEEIIDKSEYDENYEPVTTLQPCLPSWKIISVVYKPDDIYGINNSTEKRIDGVLVPSLDITFVGEEGYVASIENNVTYVAGDVEMVDPNTTFVSDDLQEDVCPDLSSTTKNHYIELFDISKVDDINDYVLGAYNGYDFVEESKKDGSTLNISKVKVESQDSTVYFNQVNGLPYMKNIKNEDNSLTSFIQYEEDIDGKLHLNMEMLGSNYVKIDVNFLEIKDLNGNDITSVVKRTKLGIISLEPHTGG